MIPDYQTLMRPVLAASSNGEVAISAVVRNLEQQFDLSEDEKTKLLTSGKQTQFANRVHWARSYLKQAGLIKSLRRGFLEVTDEGLKVLKSGQAINSKFLEKFDSFQEFKSRTRIDSSNQLEPLTEQADTPDELLRKAFAQINNSLAAELLDRLRKGEPNFFEKTLVSLLLEMGYGGTQAAGEVLGGAGDDGVDGVINQDPLGIDQIYIQAKRYTAGNNIGSGAIRDFYGALALKDVSKGIFVTTSAFTPSAIETASKLGARIVLIDGMALAELMIKHQVGCRAEEIFNISRIDDGFFE